MIASVSGRRSRIVVPRPAGPSISIDPRTASTLRRTTSSPTPRPERSVTSALVESPGAKTSWSISAPDGPRPSATSPRSTQRRAQDGRPVETGAVVAHLDDDLTGLAGAR